MPTTLTAGDIAFIGAASDDPDSFAFVLLRDVDAGTVLNFTDNGWLAAGGFRTGEGTVTWTAGSARTAGSVITFSGLVGEFTGSAAFSLSTGGDSILAYQGAAATPTLVAGIRLAAAGWDADATSSNTSALPAALAAGAAVAIGNFDNGVYAGPTTGDRAFLLGAINDPSNWTRSDLPIATPPPASFDLGGAPTVETLSIAALDAAKAEGTGPAGAVTAFTFTVTRANPDGEAGAEWRVAGIDAGGATASASDFAALQGSVSFAAGETAKTITIEVNADAVFEGAETFRVELFNATGGAIISASAGSAQGAIANDDLPPFLAIYDIQGAAQQSAFAGQQVSTSGVVTALASNGFYLQDAAGDGDAATSDGIFVFTGTAGAKPAVGAAISLSGAVSEFRPGGDANNLTITQITATAPGSFTVLSTGNSVAATALGAGGRLPPQGAIDSNPMTFDPSVDAIDFFESLEGMVLSISASISISPTNAFGEIWVASVDSTDITSLNSRGGLTISPDDFNPQRIQIDDDLYRTTATTAPNVDVGAQLGPITGVLSYSFNNYEILSFAPPTITLGSTLARETTDIVGSARTLTFASYNVENLDPVVERTINPAIAAANSDDDVGSGRVAALASQIVTNLKAPAVIALQEVQDGDGAVNSTLTSAEATAQVLIDAILAAGGPRYVYVDVAPEDDTSGGQPGGNIRPGFLYNPDVAQYVEGSSRALTDASDVTSAGSDDGAFLNSRKPLVAEFTFQGEIFTFVNNHFNSKGGDQPLFGPNQPPALNSEVQRIQQAAIVNAFVDARLAQDPEARVIVMGDLNDFSWSNPLLTLDGSSGGGAKVLFDLAEELIANPAERYSYNFQGNSQELDHIYVTRAVLEQYAPQFDVVHTNSEFVDSASDHDPSVAALTIAPPSDLDLSNASVAENSGEGAVVGAVSARGGAGVLAFALVDDAGGRFALDAQNRIVVVAGAALDFEGANPLDIRLRVTDAAGGSYEETFAIALTDVNEGPAAAADGGFQLQTEATIAIARSALLANDSDPDAGDILDIVSVQDAANGTVRIEGGQILFTGAENAAGPASFTYTIADSGGLTATATVSLAITDPLNRIIGTAGDDRIFGTFRGDRILAGEGDDRVFGSFGHDAIDGGDGDDRIDSGFGDDRVMGGNGDDRIDGGFGDDLLSGGNDDDRIESGFGDDTMVGGDGDDLLVNSFGSDRMEGGAGDDILQGSFFSADTFVFGVGDGRDRIDGFRGDDVVELDAALAASFADVLADALQVGRNVVIGFDDSTSLTLQNLRLSSLQADDFRFI